MYMKRSDFEDLPVVLQCLNALAERCFTNTQIITIVIYFIAPNAYKMVHHI